MWGRWLSTSPALALASSGLRDASAEAGAGRVPKATGVPPVKSQHLLFGLDVGSWVWHLRV